MKRTLFILIVVTCRLQCILATPPDSSRVSFPRPDSDSTFIAFLREAGVPFSDNNRIRLLKSGAQKFDDLFTRIEQARHHIHLEYFNFRNDSIGNALFHLLARKAQEGVEVRALFDAFGNWSNDRPLKESFLKTLRSQGIDIVKFDPIRFPYVNHAAHRDHRKIAVVDGQTAYTGGMNVADYYIYGLPKIGPWRDMHARIEGQVVTDLQRIFLQAWAHQTGQQLSDSIYCPPPAAGDSLVEVTPSGLDTTLTHCHVTMATVDRTPRQNSRLLSQAYAQAIEAAHREINIVNPYFVPTASIGRALRTAIKKGVQVNIMVSAASDISFTPDAALHKLHKLMKKGANVYLYENGFHHSKLMMVDDTFCTLGTANLNSRSLRYDYETNVFIFNEAVTRELNQGFEADLKQCTPLTSELWKKRSTWKKFVGWFANLFTPFL